MITQIGRTVTVGAVFEPDQVIVPKWFLWNGRKYPIERVTFTWKVREGQKPYHHFAVTDGTKLYELTYDAVGSSWKLMAVSDI